MMDGFYKILNYTGLFVIILFLSSCGGGSKKTNEVQSGNNVDSISGVAIDSTDIHGIQQNDQQSDDLIRLSKTQPNSNPAATINPQNAQKLAKELLKSPEYYSQMGNRLCGLGKFTEGIDAFSKAIELESDNLTHYRDRGRARLRTADYKGALKDLTKSAPLNNTDTSQYMAFGLANYFNGNYKIALEAFNSMVQKNPKMPGLYYNRGLAYAQLNELKKAIDDFSKTIINEPGHHMAYFNRGLANLMLGNTEQACDDWENARNHGSPDAGEALKEYCK